MVPEVISLQDSLGKALTQRPDLQALKLNLEKQGIELKYRRNQLYPQLDLKGTYGQSGSGEDFSGALAIIRKGDAPQYSIGVVLTVPLGNRRERNTYSIAKMERDLTGARLSELESLADYNTALANVAYAEGTTLERHKLNLEFK